MSTLDITLLVVIGGFGLFGLWFGLVHTLGSLIGTVFGVYLASRYYEPAANWLINLTGWDANVSRVVIFIMAFIVINRLVGLAFWIVDKVLSLITRLPFIRSINRLFGLIFGLLEGALVIGIIFYFIARFPVGDKFMALVAQSRVIPSTVKLAGLLWPLLPDALRTLKSTIEGLM